MGVWNIGPPAPGAVAGTVTDADTGDPVAGATVTVDGESVMTDVGNDGDYVIDGLDAGMYTVTATAWPYGIQSQEVVVHTGETTTADFALRRGLRGPPPGFGPPPPPRRPAPPGPPPHSPPQLPPVRKGGRRQPVSHGD